MLSSRKCNNKQPTHFVDADALGSAKRNLKDGVSYFGMYEDLELSEKLFTSMFGGEFTRKIEHGKAEHSALASRLMELLPEALIEQMREKSNLDVELYEYAQKLITERASQYNLQR